MCGMHRYVCACTEVCSSSISPPKLIVKANPTMKLTALQVLALTLFEVSELPDFPISLIECSAEWDACSGWMLSRFLHQILMSMDAHAGLQC